MSTLPLCISLCHPRSRPIPPHACGAVGQQGGAAPAPDAFWKLSTMLAKMKGNSSCRRPYACGNLCPLPGMGLGYRQCADFHPSSSQHPWTTRAGHGPTKQTKVWIFPGQKKHTTHEQSSWISPVHEGRGCRGLLAAAWAPQMESVGMTGTAPLLGKTKAAADTSSYRAPASLPQAPGGPLL